ncbi:hypothetical protein [Hwanghaeella sp.]|uniref:DUF4376 domain-containing protein n=1 Tax=Hwanghaeella sp. TaxID=2605943 RepID=UPI003CCC1817
MRYARIQSGTVMEVVDLDEGETPADFYHSAIAETFVEDPSDTAAPGFTFDGTAFSAPAAAPVTREMIAAEAERRIAAGIFVDAKAFRADDASVSRVREMLDAFVAGIVSPEGVTFRTAAGDEFTLTAEAAARSIYEAQITHRAAVLAASSSLQDTLPADYLTNAAWPVAVSITL